MTAPRDETQHLAQAEQAALTALQGPLFDALSASGVSITVTDPRQPDDPIVYVNAAFEALSGYAASQVLGRNCRFMQSSETDRLTRARIAARLAAGKAVTLDVLNQKADGAPFWNRLNISIIRDAEGAALYRFATQADVTCEYADSTVGEQLRRSRQMLAETQERLRVVQAIGGAAGAWEWNIASGMLVADIRFADLNGLDPLAIADGMPVSSFFAAVHADDLLRLRIAVAGALHGAEVFAREYRIVRPGGGVLWVSAKGRTYLDEDGRAVRFCGVLTDVTDQKRVEDQLRVAQTAGGVGSFEYVRGYGTADVSDQFCQLLGLHTASSLPVRTINALVHGDDPPLIQTDHARRGADTAFQEFRIRRADTGEVRWLALRGEYRPDRAGGASFIGVIYDITSAKHAEAQLRDLAETLEMRVAERTQERDRVWKLSRDLLYVVGPDGLYRAANPAWKALLGYDEVDLIGVAPAHFVHPDDQLTAWEGMAKFAHEAGSNFDCRIRAKSGAYHWVNWTATSEGDLVYGIGRDVTQRKALEDQLRQSQKMEAVGQLTGGLAHDFNNMLTGILGGIDMVRRRVKDGRYGEVDRFLDAATQSGQRAAALTHRLLAFSRRQTLDSRPIDVALLAQSMADLLRRTLGEQVSLRIVMPPDLGPAIADDNQLESAILNLAINARDAMPNGGELIISARNVELSSEDLVNSDRATAGAFVELDVTDTGAGMSPEIVAKVFDPFFTTKPLGQGTGLGLSMIYGFVQQSQGHVVIDSEEGRGTTIRMFLPRYAGMLDDRNAPAYEAAPLGAGETVLIVEDDPAVRLLVMQVLDELGYQAIETSDGQEAIPILESTRHLDLLISDVGLPGVNGRQLAELARRHRPKLPILFMTGYARQATDQAAFLDEGMEIISKPFEIDDFGRRIRDILGQYKAAG
ncbi:MAG: hybrid sensor histidine kinase/response regulator [Caulobacteraceae bacterium]